MTKPKRKIIRRPARKSSKKAWPLSSLIANWFGDPGFAWRALLPFVLIASLIAIGAGALFSYRSASGDTRSRRDVATIVFVEADVPPRATEPGEKDQDACGAAKTGAVWKEAENLLEAYWKRAVRAQDGAKWSLWMYALNGAPGAGNELLRIGPHELGDVRKARGLTRTQRELDGWKKYAETAKVEYEKSFEPHPRQDIVATIRFLLTNRNKFIGEDVGVIKVVYLSDMFHYNCDAAAVDPEAGYWNFLSLDAVARFQKQIDEGILYHHDSELTSVSVPIEPLIDKTGDKTGDRVLEIFSVSIPRLACESLPAQEVNRILATGLIQKTWERLFEKMNAKSVLLNVDGDSVFER